MRAHLDESLQAYRRALQLNPDLMWAHSNLVFTMLFHPGCSPEEILAENRRWNAKFAAPLARYIRPWHNTRDAQRPLRIGYVSPDLCAHPVGRFLLPILSSHDSQNYTVIVYSSTRRTDQTTTALQQFATEWRDVKDSSDEQLTELIRQDKIDILVDLSMHMAHHRLLVFARKPAPIQLTYLAYVGTTGLDAIDYRLTDYYLDPTPECQAWYSERSLFLPDCYWCYHPVLETTVAANLPADRNAYVTLGSLNNLCKVTPQTLEAWCEIMRQVPNARLRLSTGDGSATPRLEDILRQQSIDPARIETIPHLSLRDYFSSFGEVDVALDPFPYGGGTTTCDALWMGVPVVTLAGRTAVGRGGASILSNVGLHDMIAIDVEQYIHIVCRLCQDRGRLRELRSTLRNRMARSPLMDAQRFTQNLERLYREIWRRWCASNPAQNVG